MSWPSWVTAGDIANLRSYLDMLPTEEEIEAEEAEERQEAEITVITVTWTKQAEECDLPWLCRSTGEPCRGLCRGPTHFQEHPDPRQAEKERRLKEEKDRRLREEKKKQDTKVAVARRLARLEEERRQAEERRRRQAKVREEKMARQRAGKGKGFV